MSDRNSRRRSLGTTTPGPLLSTDSTKEKDTKDSKETVASPVPNTADAIKVLCRFRPPTINQQNSSQKDQLHNLYRIDQQRNEIDFTSDFVDGKAFTFDKVCLNLSFHSFLSFFLSFFSSCSSFSWSLFLSSLDL
jgi:hypothetical protein